MGRKIHFYTCRTGMGSDRCRGMDIAEKMKMPCDEPYGAIEADDIVLTVKHFNPAILEKSKHVYVDIVDGSRGPTYDTIRRHESVTVVTLTPMGAKWIKQSWFPNHRVIWIPHTHCNDENRIRPHERAVTTLMYNGTANGFAPAAWGEFVGRAKREGFEVVRKHTISSPHSVDLRKDCCDAYLACDIQVAFRPHFEDAELPLHLKSATKLNNAASFRVPSVAYPETAFTHNYGKAGRFAAAETIEQMIQACMRLRDEPDMYRNLYFDAWVDAQPYHIDKVVKHYERLLC